MTRTSTRPHRSPKHGSSSVRPRSRSHRSPLHRATTRRDHRWPRSSRTTWRAIGIHVEIKPSRPADLFSRLAIPGEPFDIAYAAWYADYPDPSQLLNWLLDGTAGSRHSTIPPTAPTRGRVPFRPAALPHLRALDLDLARNAAPLAAFGNPSSHDFFSARIGCQIYGVYGMDLAALCIKASRHQ